MNFLYTFEQYSLNTNMFCMYVMYTRMYRRFYYYLWGFMGINVTINSSIVNRQMILTKGKLKRAMNLVKHCNKKIFPNCSGHKLVLFALLSTENALRRTSGWRFHEKLVYINNIFIPMNLLMISECRYAWTMSSGTHGTA